LAASPYTAETLARTIDIPEEKVLTAGLPKNDVFFREIAGADIDSHPQLKSLASRKSTQPGRYILYAPTFRRWECRPNKQLHLEKLHEHLERENSFLFITLHRLHAVYCPCKISVAGMPRITVIDSGYDLYPHLRLFDALITDYSNIFTDFVLLDKPAYFFVPDLEEYKNAGALHKDFEKLAPGPLVRTTEELIEALSGKDKWHSKRQQARTLFFTHKDGRASERIAQSLMNKYH